ncbi:MAG: dihydrodipicolinate synthase family protein [Gemmatimonadota bacterium]
MLTRETFVGPWAGLPVAWTDEDAFDEEAYRADVVRCCQAGVPGVYSGGTTGEFYAMELDEFQQVSRALVEECQARGVPAMVGVTATYTLGAIRRAQWAADVGASAVQVALPFWMQVGEEQVVPFFREVARAVSPLPLSIYETTRAKKALTLAQHRAIREAVPGYLMVKANAGTIGSEPDGCQALSEFVNVFVGEHRWPDLGRRGAVGCCSSMVYWNPRVILELWGHLREGRWEEVDAFAPKLKALHGFLAGHFAAKGFTDTAYDRMGGRAGGFLKCSLRSRGPYPSASHDDVERLRQWYAEHFPEMLRL